MLTRTQEPLSRWTTLRLGGPARRFVEVTTRDELYDEVQRADREHEGVLLIGAGSNLVVADDGFAGTVIRVASRGVTVGRAAGSPAVVSAEAGEDWDTLVARIVQEGLSGLEALSGIPGTVGAVPIQNVGAYGQDVAETLSAVHVWDRQAQQECVLANAECGFGYRTSIFKRSPGRYVVGAVEFGLPVSDLGGEIRYAELARRLGVESGERPPSADVRAAVLDLRRGKGMVLDAADHDTWSVGSFFTNPFVQPDELPLGAPSYPQPDGRVKTSAAWLIERAGVGRGYGGGQRASISTKHTLALTNRGEATTSDLLALARDVRARVTSAFGITLEPEPTLVNCSL